MIKTFIKKATEPIRHRVVKLIAPKMYYGALYRSYEDTPRRSTVFMMNYFKNRLVVGAEIGASRGLNSLSLLQSLNIERIYLIDPYLPYLDKNQYDEEYINFHSYKAELIERLSIYKKKFMLICAKSDDGLKRIHEKLDFIYIDGNHSFDWVTHDLIKSYELLKSGGVLAGHDYAFIDDVTRAVHNFMRMYNLELQAKYTDFWFVKK